MTDAVHIVWDQGQLSGDENCVTLRVGGGYHHIPDPFAGALLRYMDLDSPRQRSTPCADKPAVPVEAPPRRSLDFTAPYRTKNGWATDESLYPESRGFVAHDGFASEAEAWGFIHNQDKTS